MPIYNFRNKETRSEWSNMMTISERDEFLANNPHIEQIVCAPVIATRIVRQKPDGAFRDKLKEIKKNNPGSRVNDF